MKKAKRAIAWMLSVIMTVGCCIPAGAAPNELEGGAKPTPLAWYPLTEDVGDYSGNDFNGELVGGATVGEDGLYLPGGGKRRDYVKLPGEIFQGEDNLTISVWLKSNTDKGNYAALFFGTPANANSVPTNYWLFNPTNPNNLFKSVFTDSDNETKPWETEAGVAAHDTSVYKNKWVHYTTVLTPDSVEGYVNGRLIGTAEKTKTVAEFGDVLEAYIGCSNYLNDPDYSGTFQDLRVYGEALDAQGVADVYQDTETVTEPIIDSLLEDAKGQLDLGELSAVTHNLELPSEGANGTAITWETSDPTVISTTGEVFLGDEAKDAILTATLSIGGRSVQREFPVHTLPQSEVSGYILGKLSLPYTISEHTVLPESIEGRAITWTSDNQAILGDDGVLHGPESGFEKVTLTAQIDLGAEGIQSKQFQVQVAETGASLAAGYTRSTSNKEIGKSMHLALSADGSAYEALHNNMGLLFAKTYNVDAEGDESKILSEPYIFRMPDGTFGIVAVRAQTSGTDAEDAGKLLFCTSEDLIDYREIGMIDLKTEGLIKAPACEYDGAKDQYRITWKGEDGNTYSNTIGDLNSLSCDDTPKESIAADKASADLGIPNAESGNVIPVTKAEAERLQNRLGEIVNTGVSLNQEQITTSTGEAADLSGIKASLTYSDGQTFQRSVDWDTTDVNWNQPGTYTVKGTIRQSDIDFPVIQDRADPNILHYNGKYYFIATDENGQGKLYIRSGKTVSELKNAQDHLILNKTGGGDMSGCLWAPELHVVNGELYIFFAASTNGAWDAVQCRLMKLKTPDADPTNADNWEAPVRVVRKDGSALYSEGITLDMTYIEENGVSYVVWAERRINPTWSSNIMIATIDPEKPYQLTSDPVRLCAPDYGWDRNTTPVDEGPFAIRNKDGQLFITFSGAGVNPSYCVGMLACTNADDMLNPDSWQKSNYPLLLSESVPGEYGPGHNSYYVNEDGNYVNVYHALPQNSGGKRHAGIREVYWSVDGTPVLDMTADEAVLPENKEVSVEVVVEGEPVVDEKELILNYDFSSVEGNIVKDMSGKGNDGEIKGKGAAVENGTLTLPGGAAGSSAGYVQLPTGMFDNQDTLTISVWLKNQTGKGNYAAMFFGTTESLPLQYWLLNPCNPSGRMKSVVTNSVNAGQPYMTEYGFSPTDGKNGVNGPVTDDSWGLYTTVIQPGFITAYFNGEKVGSVKTARNVSDFGEELVAYIGRSSYNDMFYKGQVRNVKVSADVWTQDDISKEYGKGLAELDALTLQMDKTTVVDDIALITEGAYGSTISWASSDENVIAKDGTVTRPAKGKGDAKITLTATVTNLEQSVTKEFVITVLENDPSKDLMLKAQEIDLNTYFVTSNVKLPADIDGIPITWSSSSELIKKDGTVTRPEAGKGSQEVTLTATLTQNQASAKREFKLVVVEKYSSLLTYVTTGNTQRSDALFLAALKDGTYEALNNGKAILYGNGGTQMGSPSLFRKADGTYGLIASVNNDSSSVLIYESGDLISFTNEKQAELAPGKKVKNPVCIYDGSTETYKIYWDGSDGKSYVTGTKDFTVFGETKEAAKPDSLFGITQTLPGNAVKGESNAFEVTKAEYDAVTKKYSRIKNTGISSVDGVTVEKGGDIELPSKVTASYSDGSSKDMAVEWDTGSVKLNEPGTYQVTGEVAQTEYFNPLIEERADPCVTYDEENDCYYFTASYPTRKVNDPEGYDRIVLRTAKTINGLKDAEEIVIWDEKDHPQGRYIWAPEIHKIGDTWCVLFTASLVENNVWNLKPHIITCEGTAEGGVMNPDNWGEAQRVDLVEGDQDYQGLSIDMTYFETNGQSYYAWSEKPGSANIYIATVDPSNPSKLTSKKVMLSSPDFAWEWNAGQYINEGPAVIQNDGKVYLCFSGATVDDKYCVGMLSADASSDLLDQESWTKNPYPIFTTSDCEVFGNDDLGNTQVGPGHNSFTVDQAGNPVIVYHARTKGQKLGPGDGGLDDPGRHARAKSVNFAADGTPVLYMTAEEELAPENRTITTTVTVSGDVEEPVEIKITPAEAVIPAESSLPLTAAGNYEGELTWSSSNSRIAVVDQNGVVTGVRVGTATVTAEDSKGNQGSAKITVTKKLQPHWVAENGKWKYSNGDGTYAENCWRQIRGQWYHFDGEGYMQTGWILDGGKWYYLNRDGIMETGWILDGSKWYYLRENGVMATGWLSEGNTWYYLKANGAMATGWLLDGKTWYYLKANGAMATGWLLDGKTWYYLKANGAMATGWLLDGKTWYYLKSSGAMVTGWLLDGKTWYYLNGNGSMATGWIQVSGKWYYLKDNGAMAANTWIGKYYVNSSGVWTKTK